MSYDMMIRKKALKIQERLGMRIGIMYGTSRTPYVRTLKETMDVLRELYRIGMKAFVLPKELFSGIRTAGDLYKIQYGELLKIKEEAQKLNIELSLHQPNLSSEPDEELRIFANINSIMDARVFTIAPNFYSKMMPHEQALKLAVHKVNEIVTGLRFRPKIGVETTGRLDDVGSLEDVIDFVKRTEATEAVINWGNIHARGAGSLRTQDDFRRVMEGVKKGIGTGWMHNAYFIVSGVSYGPSGVTRQIPLEKSDIPLELLIKEIMSQGIKGTLVFQDTEREKFILKVMERLADMVR